MSLTGHTSEKRLGARSVPGGVHLENHKAHALRSRLMPTPLPDCLILPLQQGCGGLARAMVKVGDLVLKYQQLAEPANDTGHPLFAPTSGRIVSDPVTGDATGSVIRLQPDGDNRAAQLNLVADYRELSSEALIARIAAAGVVGLGGAAFPTAVKLQQGLHRQIDLLIVNALECDPYTSADESLIREHADVVVEGAAILHLASRAERCVLAISEEKQDCIKALRQCLKDSSIELFVTPERYPLGEEAQLVLAVSGREVPSGRLPLHTGTLVFNAGTAHAVRQAVCAGRPQTSRVVTLTGSALVTPKNFEVPLGTPISHLLRLCGWDQSRSCSLIVNGSMRGYAGDADMPVTETVSAIVAATEAELAKPPPEQACIHCGNCTEACPVRLQPQQLYQFARRRDQRQLLHYGLPDCIDCGACNTVCPSHIPLTDYFAAARAEMRTIQSSRKQSLYWQQRFQFHQARMRKEKDRDKPRRKQVATSENPQAPGDFSRERARAEIAAAVARVKSRRAGQRHPEDDDEGQS